MTNPSVTYTFTNSTTADGPQVSQNFTDLINAMTDGTKSFSIDALTCAGAVLLNGNVTLGNASSDDVTVTGSLASHIPVKTNSTYDIGDSTHALRVLYSNRIVGGTTAGTSILGRTDGNAPNAGDLGAKIEQSYSGVDGSTGWANATSVSVTAGTWIPCAIVMVTANATNVTSVSVGYSTDSGASTFSDFSATLPNVYNNAKTTATNTDLSAQIVGAPITVASTTTYYCKISTGVGAPTKVAGKIWFVRIA